MELERKIKYVQVKIMENIFTGLIMKVLCSRGCKAVFDEDTSHLGCDTMSLGEYLPTFRSIALTSFPRSDSPTRTKQSG
jgi:hypothetical protein